MGIVEIYLHSSLERYLHAYPEVESKERRKGLTIHYNSLDAARRTRNSKPELRKTYIISEMLVSSDKTKS